GALPVERDPPDPPGLAQVDPQPLAVVPVAGPARAPVAVDGAARRVAGERVPLGGGGGGGGALGEVHLGAVGLGGAPGAEVGLGAAEQFRSEEHTSELQSRENL